MAYTSKFKGSEIDSILNDVKSNIKQKLTSLQNNLSSSITDINSRIESINKTISNVPNDINNIKKDVEENKKDIKNKQNTISDLQTIREGAAKGATALQSYTEKYTGTYNKPNNGIPKSDLSSTVQTSLGKADSAIQKIKTINGKSLIGEGNIVIESSISNNTSKFRTTTVGSPQVYVCNVDATGVQIFENVSKIYEAFDALATEYPKMFKSNGSLGKDASGTYDIKYYTLGKTNPRITTDRVGNNTNL
jgi:predicted RNase H-like nuclease (RuvC/YqgF family)